MKSILPYLVAAVIFGLLDSLWFAVFMKKFAIQELRPILNLANGQMDVRMSWALTAYALMIVIAVAFLWPQINSSQSWVATIFLGALMGVCVFGIFDSTNAALLSVYPVRFLIIDTIWGGVMYSVLAVSYRLMKSWVAA